VILKLSIYIKQYRLLAFAIPLVLLVPLHDILRGKETAIELLPGMIEKKLNPQQERSQAP
jgi:hypothetical protein